MVKLKKPRVVIANFKGALSCVGGSYQYKRCFAISGDKLNDVGYVSIYKNVSSDNDLA